MAKRREIALQHLNALLRATGRLFPATEEELDAFLKLSKADNLYTNPEDIDPNAIWDREHPLVYRRTSSDSDSDLAQSMRMAARGSNKLPDELKNKMRANQKRNDTGD
jgi:hypothetical protein